METHPRQAGGNEPSADQCGQRGALENEPRQGQEPAATPRDYLANERTLLAWVRTGVALIGLGFVVARFGLFLREVAGRGNAPGPAVLREPWSTLLGTLIMLLAALLLGLSYLRYRDVTQALDRGVYEHRRGLAFVMVILVLLLALGLAAYLLLTS
jgi:putative membrane protein